MAKLLLECGAEIDAITNVNNTALQLGKCGFGNSRLEELNKLNHTEKAKNSSECGAEIFALSNVKNQIIQLFAKLKSCPI